VYKVVARLTDNRYRLEHVVEGNVIEVHAERLVAFDSSRTKMEDVLSFARGLPEGSYGIDAIRGHRKVVTTAGARYDFKVKWTDWPYTAEWFGSEGLVGNSVFKLYCKEHKLPLASMSYAGQEEEDEGVEEVQEVAITTTVAAAICLVGSLDDAGFNKPEGRGGDVAGFHRLPTLWSSSLQVRERV